MCSRALHATESRKFPKMSDEADFPNPFIRSALILKAHNYVSRVYPMTTNF